jgi:hypothetical protein
MRRAVGSHKFLIATVAALLSGAGGRGGGDFSANKTQGVCVSTAYRREREKGKSGIHPIIHSKFLLLASLPFPLCKVPNIFFLLKSFPLRFLANILLLDVFHYLTKQSCSGSFHKASSFKF